QRVARSADDRLAALEQHGREHAEWVGLAGMDEAIEFGRRQLTGGAEETVVTGARGQRAGIGLQRLGIARLDEAHGYHFAATRAQHVRILPEVVETHRGHGSLPRS